MASFDSGNENWHDFEVASRREILSLLRSIGEKKQLVRALVPGDADASVTSILEVDEDNERVVLDNPVNPDQTRRMVTASKVNFETSLDKIRILFNTTQVREIQYQGGPALAMALPASMIRLQRREYYRMPTPVSNPVRALIQIPSPEGALETHAFPLADISCGGIAILDNKLMLGNTIGQTFNNCRIDLPEIGPITVTLQIRNVIDMTLLNNKENRRLGCAFVNMGRAADAAVQRYITKLERERNARLAGKG